MTASITKISRLAGVAALAWTAIAGAALAWEPTKPIDFVIMAGKGGGADKMARLMQSIVEKESLSPRPLVPTNKPGGSGAEALVHMKNARDPDHTIMVTLNSFFTTPLRQPGLGVDIMTFAPIGRMAEDTFLLWVHKDEGVRSFEDFMTKAKAAGPKWVMGGTGKAAEDNIITDYLNKNYGLQKIWEHDQEVLSEALGFYESGDLIPLVAFTDERLPMFPDVPTLKEIGGDFSYYMQRAVVGATGMSPEAEAFYTSLFKKVYDSADWQTYKSKKSLLGDFMSGAELKDYWKVQLERHKVMLKASGAIK